MSYHLYKRSVSSVSSPHIVSIVMERWCGKVALVTGASSGIGAATALELASQGMKVVGLARRQEMVDSLRQKLPPDCTGVLHSYKADVRSEDDVVAAFKWVEEQFGGADVLVNNAGIIDVDRGIKDGTVDQWKAILDTNVIGTTICTREFLKSLDSRGLTEGHIVNINSVISHMTSRQCPMYVASKHAFRALSGYLRKTLAEQDSRIKVTDVCPGMTKTAIMDGTSSEGLFDRTTSMEPKDIAAAVIAALGTSPITQICEMVLNPVPTKTLFY